MCQFAVREKKERERAAGISVSRLQKGSIGTILDISVSIHQNSDIFYNTMPNIALVFFCTCP